MRDLVLIKETSPVFDFTSTDPCLDSEAVAIWSKASFIRAELSINEFSASPRALSDDSLIFFPAVDPLLCGLALVLIHSLFALLLKAGSVLLSFDPLGLFNLSGSSVPFLGSDFLIFKLLPQLVERRLLFR